MTRRFIARVCYGRRCRNRSTISHYVPFLKRSAYLCVKCGRKIADQSLELKDGK